MRQNLREQKRETNWSTIIGGNFKTLFYLIKQVDEKENLFVIFFFFSGNILHIISILNALILDL